MSLTEIAETPLAGRLLAEVTCPNCWCKFPPEQLLFISRHSSLVGDDVVGPSAYRRFLPTRFTVSGNALDARGVECQQLACPHCHLEIARPLIEIQPLFISIVGAPASGKSYFLASMTWMMRNHGPKVGLGYADGNPMANHELQSYEETLFLAANPDQPVEIRKTEMQGAELYQTIMLDGESQSYPQPFVFTALPTRDNPRYNDPQYPYRSIVLYDNAGEHYLPGADNTITPVTNHLAKCSVIQFLFDPTQDPRFRARCNSNDPQLQHGIRPGSSESLVRQEVILNEVAARVRKNRGLSHTERHNRPLVVILAKADVWIDMIDESIDAEPFIDDDPALLDVRRIESMSDKCRKLMKDLCPEIVAAAEGFCSSVIYVPVSALGTSPEKIENEDGWYYGIRPANIKPRWATASMLWSLAHEVPDMIPTNV